MNKDINKLKPAEQLVEIMTRIYNKKLTTPSGGNISMKDNDGNVWVTPSQIDKGTLTVEDMVMITPEKKFLGIHKPTSEYPFHLNIYSVRPEIKAITHAHPTALVAFSAVHREAKFYNIPEITKFCSNIGYSDYAIPGSEKLGDNVKITFDKNYDLALMENHGIITTAATLLDSFHKMEAAEHMANIHLDALKIGHVINLSENEFELSKNYTGNKLEAFTKTEKSDVIKEKSKELLEFVKRSYERGLFLSVLGGMSIRVDEDSFLISPAGKDIEYLTESDLVLVKNGKSEEGKTPLSFVDIHIEIYKNHKNVNSIATALPQSMMAFAISDLIFDSRTIPESYIFLKTIPTLNFNDRYTDISKLSKEITNNSPNIICQNECFVVTGDNAFQVFDRLEVAEFTARSIIDSKQLGEIVPMKEEDINEIIRVYLS